MGSPRANECPKCGDVFPADLGKCPFCDDSSNRTHHRNIRDDYDD